MANHYIQYIPRHVRLGGNSEQVTERTVEDARSALSYQRPLLHRTRLTKGIVKDIRPGDTIWLLGRLSTPWGKLPIALDARIDVADCSLGADESVFIAADTSQWFPLRDATALVDALRVQKRNGITGSLCSNPNLPVGIYLQQLRQLASAEVIITWANQLNKKGYTFVSYRQKDGTHAAFKQIEELLAADKAVFWDRWSLPRQLAEYHKPVPDSALKRHLEDLISKAQCVWGIATPFFGEAESFSAYERAIAEKLGLFSAHEASLDKEGMG